MDWNGWNAGEASQLLNRREWILLKGIKNCLLNNNRRWFLGAVNKNRGELPLTQIFSYDQIGDCIRAKYSSKFVVDGPGRKSFEREKQAD
jgi:hypothetical protein